LAFSQLIVMWSGNLPDEVPWYLERSRAGWGAVAWFLAVAQFGLPFLVLLSRDAKRSARTLPLLAAGVAAVQLVAVFWRVVPALRPRAALTWMDVVAPLGIGALWVATFLRSLRSVKPAPAVAT